MSDTTELRVAAVLFDCDGVLVDSLEVVDRCWSAWIERVGLDPAEVLSEIHGFRAVEIIARFAPERDPISEERWMEDLEVAESTSIRAVAGSPELYASIPDHRRAVATSAATRLAVARLRAAGFDLPRVLIGADRVSAGKPDPEPYLLAARGLGVEASATVVFEDTAAGVRAGVAAGATVVGVRTTLDEAGLMGAGATTTVPDLRSVAAEVRPDGLVVRISTAGTPT